MACAGQLAKLWANKRAAGMGPDRRISMRRKMLAFSAALVVLAAPVLGAATPAAAHVGHTSCEGGILLIVDQGWPWPESGPGEGPSGAGIVALAQMMVQGVLEPGDPPRLAHEAICEPKAP
jgi:hypothetical protein